MLGPQLRFDISLLPPTPENTYLIHNCMSLSSANSAVPGSVPRWGKRGMHIPSSVVEACLREISSSVLNYNWHSLSRPGPGQTANQPPWPRWQPLNVQGAEGRPKMKHSLYFIIVTPKKLQGKSPPQNFGGLFYLVHLCTFLWNTLLPIQKGRAIQMQFSTLEGQTKCFCSLNY